MRIRTKHTAFSAALALASFVWTSPAGAISIVSSLRSIDLGGAATTRSLPGAFVNTVSGGNTNSSSTASQDTSLSQTATLLHVTGNGSTSAQHAVTFATSQLHVSNSFLDTSFSLLNDSQFVLSGILSVADQVLLGGSPRFDNSAASVLLAESSGPTVFSFTSNGSFNQSGLLAAGKMYHLRIESGLSLQTREIFSKTNGWTIDFIASEVPEPSAMLLAVGAVVGMVGAARRR